MTYTLTIFDDKEPTHVLCEKFLTVDKIVQMNGYMFVPPALASELGAPNDVVKFGSIEFPAWRMRGEVRP